MKDLTTSVNRRSLLKATAASGLVLATPTIFSRGAWAQNFANDPTNKSSVTFGFNVPQTGAYADEGADELRAYQLAVKHLNGEGDGGMLQHHDAARPSRVTASSARRSSSLPATPRPSRTPLVPLPSG